MKKSLSLQKKYVLSWENCSQLPQENIEREESRQAKKKDATEHFPKEELECKKHEQPTYPCIILSYFFTFCINHNSITPATKAIKAHVNSATNPTALPRKLKMALTTLLTITGNASTVFPANILRVSASLFNTFFKASSSFGGDDPEAAKDVCNNKNNC